MTRRQLPAAWPLPAHSRLLCLSLSSALCLFLALSLCPTPAAAGGFTITIIGGRRTACQANVAAPDDLTAIFHNPAGLANQKGFRFHFSGSLTFVDSTFQLQALDPVRFPEINPEGCGQPGAAACPWPIGPDGYYARPIRPESTFGVLPYFAVSTDLGFIRPSLRDVVVGFAVSAPDFYGGTMGENSPTAYQMISGYFLVAAATAAVGWRPSRYVALGANLSYNFMHINFAQKISIIDSLTPQGQEPSGTAVLGQQLLGDLRLDYSGTDHGVGWSASVLVDPTPWLTFGFTYNGASSAAFEGDVRFRPLGAAVADQPEILKTMLDGFGYKLPQRLRIEMPIPHMLLFGVAVRPTPRLELTADYRVWLYNAYKQQVITPIYDPTQPGQEPFSQDSLTRDKNYGVSWEVSAGVLFRPLWRHPELELMAGFGYDESPVPDESFTVDNPSLSLFQIGIGARYTIKRHVRLALTYLLLACIERDVKNSNTSPPTNARGGNLTHIPGIEVEYIH